MKRDLLELIIRRQYDARECHFSEIIQHLYSPEHISIENVCEFQRHHSIASSLQLHPIQWNWALSHSRCGDLIVIDIENPTQPTAFAAENSSVVVNYAQWYPIDTGSFARIKANKWEFVETSSCETVIDIPESFVHFDWNTCDANQLALVKKKAVKLTDLRVGGSSLTTINSPSKHSSKLCLVHWHPLDERGLFVANGAGTIFFYDTRVLRRPLTESVSMDRNLDAPITFMSVSPDYSKLITHSNELIQWNLKLRKNPDKAIENSGVRFQASNNIANQFVQPLITTRRIYASMGNAIGQHRLVVFDRQTGMYTDLSSEDQVASHIAGVRRTKLEDDIEPRLLFFECHYIFKFRLCRLLNFEQSAKKERQARKRKRSAEETRSVEQLPQEQRDRWSDDEN